MPSKSDLSPDMCTAAPESRSHLCLVCVLMDASAYYAECCDATCVLVKQPVTPVTQPVTQITPSPFMYLTVQRNRTSLVAYTPLTRRARNLPRDQGGGRGKSR